MDKMVVVSRMESIKTLCISIIKLAIKLADKCKDWEDKNAWMDVIVDAGSIYNYADELIQDIVNPIKVEK